MIEYLRNAVIGLHGLETNVGKEQLERSATTTSIERLKHPFKRKQSSLPDVYKIKAPIRDGLWV